jgi:hypothetical protein
MRSVILCEGADEVYFLGYLLHKCSRPGHKWIYEPRLEKKFSALYSFPALTRNERREIYQRSEDRLAIWGVGGKERFQDALKDIHTININHPRERLENIVIVSDRDQNEIDEALRRFERHLRELGWNVSLSNNGRNKITYAVEGEEYDVYICPVIIPFDENGALETVLMNAIFLGSQEDAYVVSEAKCYVSAIYESGKAAKYLRHARERLKAEFSSTISIINPDRSTAKFNELFMSHEWEKSDYITNQFRLLLEILG